MNKWKQRYVDYKELGLCARCGKMPPIEGTTKCISCTEYQAQTSKDIRSRRKSMGLCQRCGKLETTNTRAWCQGCYDKKNSKRNKANALLTLSVYDQYGGKCICCGEVNRMFLTLDHVKDDGYEHRRTDLSAAHLAKWAAKNNYPETLQLMCYNCNMGKHRNKGTCPHTISPHGVIGY